CGSSMPHQTIHLFRKGLRLHDNPTLLAALKSSEVVYPVYILDRDFLTSAVKMGIVRWHFLLQCLEDLQSNLKKLNSCLWIIQGEYEAVLREHVQKWNISQVTLDNEIEPFYKQMERTIQDMGKEMGFEVFSLVGHTLYDVSRIVELNKGIAPLTYKRFLHILTLLGDPEMPVQDVAAENAQKLSPLPEEGLDEQYRLPLPEDLGISKEYLSPWRGGETAGLLRLKEHLKNQGWVAKFKKPRTIPNSLLPSTTGLSPYFSFGCLSVRTFFYRLSKIYAQSKNHSLPPVSLQGQLLWREFFYTVASSTPNFTKMVGNPICLQIKWYQDAEKLHKWKTVFEELLLDADYSVNAGNWMWLSASAFFHQYTRIFCPVRFGKRTDPEGRYIRLAIVQMCYFSFALGKDYPFPMVNHKEASTHNLQLMKQVREEQLKTAQLTRDDTDDPMETRLKREHSEETEQKGKLARNSEQV
ncbi:hypothetical protein lerEdw1_016822, partial [Lerista edwardsae]